MLSQTGIPAMPMSDDAWVAKLNALDAPENAEARRAPQRVVGDNRTVTVYAPVVPSQVEAAPAAPKQFGPATDTKLVAVVNQSAAQASAFPSSVAQTSRMPHKVMREMPSLGLLDHLLKDQEIGDILVNGTHSIYIDKAGKLMDCGLKFKTHEEVWEIAERIVNSVGATLSLERPLVDTRLPDGSRVNIVAPPMAVDGVSISIRKFPSRQITLESMIEKEQLTPELGKFLSECVRSRLNIIVCGGTGSGKTTLMNALSASIGAEERVVTIEDSAELKLQQPHVVRLEAKVSTTTETAHQAVSIRDLVKNALRMRPDRIIVGESRGPEALDVLQAMNTGHDGSMTTLHANSPRDALSRLETMVSMAMPQLAIRLVRQQIAGTVNLVIHMSRCKDGSRRIMYVSEISGMEGEVVIMQDLVVYTETTPDRPGFYRWANGSPRNQLVTDAARTAGLMRGIR